MVKVLRSTIIDAPIDAVWEILRDFNSHERWHPAVSASRIEAGRISDEIGCVRDFRLTTGGALREQLLSLSDRDHTLSYCILDAPMPLHGYVAHIRLTPVTDGDRTFWCWESKFDTPPGRETELTRLVSEGIYEADFTAVKRLLAGGTGPRLFHPSSPTPGAISIKQAPTTGGGTLRAGAIVVTAYGAADTLVWQEIAVPPPGRGEVRIRHTAIGVNYIDIYCRTGDFDLLKLPGVPGMEAAGIILDVGEGVRGLSPGDRVAYACAPVGAYCELRTMNAALLVALPNHIDDRLAAAIMLKGMSAEFLLHRVHEVSVGQTILVHAAAGGVGQLLCQWACALGATVIGTVGSPEKVPVARDAGCEHVIIYTEVDFVDGVMEVTNGRGADVVYDAVGRDTYEKSFAALAICGHLVSYGQASGPLPTIDIASYAGKSASVSRPNFGHYTDTPEKLRSITTNLFRAIRMGILRPNIGLTLPLRMAAEAHRALEMRRTSGSIILDPDRAAKISE
jgi:NADPH:quinone reductase-like Zn-dependent oxidoreductase